MPGLELNHSMMPTVKKTVKRPPMWIHPEDLGGKDAAGQTFTIGVRLKTSDVRMMHSECTATKTSFDTNNLYYFSFLVILGLIFAIP